MSPRRSSRAKATSNHSSHSSSSTRGTTRTRGKDNSPDNDRPYRATSRDVRGASARMSSAIIDDPMSEDDQDEDVEDEDEEEVTRCVCGNADYVDEDGQAGENSDGFFIQCDKCHVWQHGFCVGILGSQVAPENYWCEKCKPELHKMITKTHGVKATIYLPVHAEEAENHKESHAGKRRSTMNSRDAAYDDAILARVIEESKSELKAQQAKSGSKNRKRGGSDSPEELKPGTKRARTDSSDDKRASSNSGDERSSNSSKNGKSSNQRKSTSNGSTTDNSAKRSTRNRSEKSKEKKDDSENSDESFSTARHASRSKSQPQPTVKETPTPAKEEAPPTPVPAKEKQPDTPAMAKRRAQQNGRRRRQTKLPSEDPNLDAGSPHAHAMARDHSHQGHDHSTKSLEKPSKPRIPQARMSMKDMSKRVAMISDFIARTQIDMASKNNSFTSSSSTPKVNEGANITEVDQDTYERLRSTEMMDVLTRKIVLWQKTYG